MPWLRVVRGSLPRLLPRISNYVYGRHFCLAATHDVIRTQQCWGAQGVWAGKPCPWSTNFVKLSQCGYLGRQAKLTKARQTWKPRLREKTKWRLRF